MKEVVEGPDAGRAHRLDPIARSRVRQARDDSQDPFRSESFYETGDVLTKEKAEKIASQKKDRVPGPAAARVGCIARLEMGPEGLQVQVREHEDVQGVHLPGGPTGRINGEGSNSTNQGIAIRGVRRGRGFFHSRILCFQCIDHRCTSTKCPLSLSHPPLPAVFTET